jgi:hypothetical protein
MRYIVFYADQSQCDAWDAQVLEMHPTLATATEPWRTEPGWYWQADNPPPDYGATIHLGLHPVMVSWLGDGPFATAAEARAGAEHIKSIGGYDAGTYTAAALMDGLATELQNDKLAIPKKKKHLGSITTDE